MNEWSRQRSNLEIISPPILVLPVHQPHVRSPPQITVYKWQCKSPHETRQWVQFQQNYRSLQTSEDRARRSWMHGRKTILRCTRERDEELAGENVMHIKLLLFSCCNHRWWSEKLWQERESKKSDPAYTWNTSERYSISPESPYHLGRKEMEEPGCLVLLHVSLVVHS